jgi:hypothetical protein
MINDIAHQKNLKTLKKNLKQKNKNILNFFKAFLKSKNKQTKNQFMKMEVGITSQNCERVARKNN